MTQRERLTVPVLVALLLLGGMVIGLVSSSDSGAPRSIYAEPARAGRAVPVVPSATSSLLGLVAAAQALGRQLPASRLVSVPAFSDGPGAPSPALNQPPPAVPLDSGWRYHADPGDIGELAGWGIGGAPAVGWHSVTIPNDFNPVPGRGGEQTRVGWYETTFTGPQQPAGRSWAVAFESVRRHAAVYLNGREIGTNTNPYAPFTLPASTLAPGGLNTLIVRVDNQRLTPEDWWNWGGITGPVTLEPEGRVGVSNLGVIAELGCDERCGSFHVVGRIVVPPGDVRAVSGAVRVTITAPDGQLLSGTQSFGAMDPGAQAKLSIDVPVAHPALWSPSDPQLYQVKLAVAVGSRVEQVQTLRTGMRTVAVKDGILYLNGQRLWLHGAAIHEDLPGHGAAMTDADISTIVADLRAAGANVTRAHYQLSPRLLDALDAAGIMVWAQPPVDHDDAQLATQAGRESALKLLTSTLLADRSHPSVIVDSVGNELSPDPDHTPGTLRYLQLAITLAHALSPETPVGLDTYCYTGYPPQQIYSRLNVIGISDYFGWYTGTPGHSIASLSQLAPFLELTHARYPQQAIAVTEWGAEAFYSGSPAAKGTYQFQDDYLRQSYAVFDRLPFLSGQIYWTLRDFAVAPNWLGGAVKPPGYQPTSIHHKGLLAYDGVPKPGYAIARRLFEQDPAFIAPSAFADARVRGAPATSSPLGLPALGNGQ